MVNLKRTLGKYSESFANIKESKLLKDRHVPNHEAVKDNYDSDLAKDPFKGASSLL